MLKCPFCHFENEDGALFCEQCKSDLSGVESAQAVPMAQAAPVVEAMAVAMPVVEAVPTAALGAVPVAVAEAVVISEVPVASVMAVEAQPMGGHSVEQSSPMALMPEAAASAPLSPAPTPMPSVPPASEAPTAPIAPAPTTPATTATAAPIAASGEAAKLPAGSQPRLLVLRGQKRNVEYPVYEGQNYIGRADEKPVDIDLEDQEPPDRVWSSRQHAVIILEEDRLSIEDLNSSNGTFVNRSRIYPGQPRPLAVNDVIQIGTVQLKVIV